MNARPNKNRDRHRKSRDRRNPEERKFVIDQKPTRQKRWKDMYETGELEDADTLLEDDEDFSLLDDDTENRT
jgi:hypothetical protein